MVEDVIAARTGGQDHNRRIARNVQRITRFVVIPAAALMLTGLGAFLLNGGIRRAMLDQKVTPLSALFERATVSPLGAMSIGLLALALLPMANVLYILGDSLVYKRWSDAAAAGAVAAILILSLILGRA